jgi:hypothetical protein
MAHRRLNRRAYDQRTGPRGATVRNTTACPYTFTQPASRRGSAPLALPLLWGHTRQHFEQPRLRPRHRHLARQARGAQDHSRFYAGGRYARHHPPLARSIGDLDHIVKTLQTKGAHLKATEQPIGTSTASGRAFIGMLGVFAQFETEMRKERQLAGIAKAKAEGVYNGRKQSIDREAVLSMHAAGNGATEIAKALGVHAIACIA